MRVYADDGKMALFIGTCSPVHFSRLKVDMYKSTEEKIFILSVSCAHLDRTVGIHEHISTGTCWTFKNRNLHKRPVGS